MEEQNQKEGQDQKAPSMMDSVLMAFNMGVKKMQDEGSIKSTLEAGFWYQIWGILKGVKVQSSLTPRTNYQTNIYNYITLGLLKSTSLFIR